MIPPKWKKQTKLILVNPDSPSPERSSDDFKLASFLVVELLFEINTYIGDFRVDEFRLDPISK